MAPVAFYDGHCPFCNFWVRTLPKYDRNKVFHFAHLSGKTATSYFNSKGIEIPDIIVLMENNTHLLASQAVFEIYKI
jgi:predicted DCC family thiol-disulfide oxidoreductase YuxK